VEVLVGGDEVEELLAQALDLSLQVSDGVLQLSDQEVGSGGGELGGMELVLGLDSQFVEGGDAAGTGADG